MATASRNASVTDGTLEARPLANFVLQLSGAPAAVAKRGYAGAPAAEYGVRLAEEVPSCAPIHTR